jgi:PPOX class probable F420-dependent enzyme
VNKTPTETRKVIRMTPAETTAMLQGTPNCSLATLDRDGYPHLVAMSFALDAGGNIVMTSFGKAQKVINLQRNPKVAVMVEHGTAYDKIKGVMIRGRAEVVEGAEAVLATMKLVVGKMAKLSGKAIEPSEVVITEAYRRQAEKRVVIRIHPEKWASWDHSKLGGAAAAGPIEKKSR